MLKVTSKKEDAIEVWELEGKLSGEWVGEFERYWKEHTPQLGVTVHVNLKAMTYIDAAGKHLLSEMYASGVEIKGCGCMTRAVVEEVIRDAVAQGAQVLSKSIVTLILAAICILGGV